jgi:cytochrome c5
MQLLLRSVLATCALGTLACSSTPAPPATPPVAATPDTPQEAASADDARGGRLYDRWTAEAGVEADGATRLKNLYGWDLRGAEGIYGPDYQNKSGVSARNLLAAQQSETELVAWLSAGDDELPALGGQLDEAALRDLATFIAKMQRGDLPGPDAFFSLSADAPKNYVLVAGADAAAGKTMYDDACGHCHGADGADIKIDETLSLGAFMRTKAYEGWFKILNGHPGSPMGREIEFGSAEEAASQTLGIMAALCDRGSYPALEGESDVADGDPRCGAYLK